MRLAAFIRRFRAQDRGVAATEFAIGLPVFAALVIGTLEVSHFYFVAASIENAVLRASRFGITGANDEGITRADQVRAVIKDYTYGYVDMNSVQIETSVYEQFADIGAPEPFTDMNESETYDEGEPYSDVNGNGQWDNDMAIAGLGSAGDIVLYRVQYDAASLTGALDWASRTIKLTATVAVRNEPF